MYSSQNISLDPLLGEFPYKSSGNFTNDKMTVMGFISAMEITRETQLSSIESGIKRMGITQHRLEILARVPVGTIKELRRGKRAMVADRWQKISRVIDPVQARVPVLGYVGAGETVCPIDDLPLVNGFHEVAELNCEFIDAPPGGLYRDMVALRVKGDSMEPYLSEGDIVYYNQVLRSDFNQYIGKRVVAKLKDGRVFLKTLERGQGYGKYNLRSYNAKLIESVELEWCARVAFIKPI